MQRYVCSFGEYLFIFVSVHRAISRLATPDIYKIFDEPYLNSLTGLSSKASVLILNCIVVHKSLCPQAVS